MEEKILTEKQEELINLIKKEFKDENKYIKWEKTINKTIVNKNDEIVLSAYISNQSSIHYNYKIDMTATISDLNVQISIYTETAASNGDPYCGRGMIHSTKDYNFNKNLTEFENNKEIIKYITSIFYKHYFNIESRN